MPKSHLTSHDKVSGTHTVGLTPEARAFAYFDPADPDWEHLANDGPVPLEGEGSHRSDACGCPISCRGWSGGMFVFVHEAW